MQENARGLSSVHRNKQRKRTTGRIATAVAQLLRGAVQSERINIKEADVDCCGIQKTEMEKHECVRACVVSAAGRKLYPQEQ